MGEFPSGQRGQTVNLLRIASMVRIRPPPPEKVQHLLVLDFFCVWVFGGRIRKAALSDSPVDCRNRRGFSAEKRIRLTHLAKIPNLCYTEIEVIAYV